ncbi:TonB-dependent receptor [Polaribacter sp. HL-MS24]|uniref:TonB-dependent receptor n=1 Tax=Polaribacter sp. HL-MS24 TaxID=3077735 RepID=UPI002934FBAB|nr:TonB-dependent receptor [Polaribacter sp. HL-MS24]WOC40772.1 TonB-dependent receptor [Polaribacter sp. HL-MS24]
MNIENAHRKNNRLSFSGDVDVNSKMNISSNIAYQDRSTQNNPNEGYGSLGANIFQWWQAQLDLDKLKNYRQGGNIVSWNISSPRNPTPKYWDSPYFELYENVKNQDRKSIVGNIAINYKFTNDLQTILTLNKTYEINNFDSRQAFGGLETPSYSESSWYKDRNLLTGRLLYEKELGQISLSATTGFEFDQFKLESTGASSKNGLTVPDYYSIRTSKERPDYFNSITKTKGRALYGSLTLGFKKILFLDTNLRKDWSSTAKIGDNSVFTKGATLSFIFSELIQKNTFLSYGKLRGGFAQAPRFPGPYALSETYGILNSYDDKAVLSTSSTIFNKNLKGGIREEIELGTELGFFDNKLSLDVTYFSKTDKNLPTQLSLDPTTGYSSVLVNSGEQSYKGFEIGISGSPIKNELFSWNSKFNFATLERKVIKLAEGLTQTDQRYLSDRWGGLVLRDKVGDRWGEVYGTKVKEINGKKVLNSSANYVTETNQSLGNFLPDFTGGFINSFKYKNLTLDIDMDFQVGGKYFSITQMFINYSGLGTPTVGNNNLGNPKRNPVTGGSSPSYVLAANAGADSGGTYIEGVDENGKDVAYYVDTQRWWGNQFGNISDFSYHASYLSVRNIKLGYTFPNSITKKIGFKNLKLSGYVNNAFLLFSALPNIDPSQIEQVYNNVNFMEGGQLL